MAKWIIDQYDSGQTITESRFATLDDLGVLEEHGTFEGEPAYTFKAEGDIPDLTGAQVLAMGLALLSLGMDD